MRVEQIPLLSDNYAYLVICEQTGQAAVVDPAAADPVLARVRALGVQLTAIWNTHHHWDHTGGNAALLRDDADLVVTAHASDAARVPGLTRGLEHGDAISIGSVTGRILHTPGHTTGGIVYQIEDAAFTGDSLFGAGCGRLFEGTPDRMHRSLNSVLGELGDDTRVFCGHEYTEKNVSFACQVDPDNVVLAKRRDDVVALRRKSEPTIPSTMLLERQTNPFLRCGDHGIRARLELAAGAGDVDVFAALRRLRDSF